MVDWYRVILLGLEVMKQVKPPSSAAFPKFPDIQESYQSTIQRLGGPITLPSTPVMLEPQLPQDDIIEGDYHSLPMDQPEDNVDVACISCSRAHLATIAGALDEALRFARADGMAGREVQRRIQMAENEITVMERIDLAPSAIQNSNPIDKQLALKYLPQIRRLRQSISNLKQLDELERTAASAETVANNIRTEHAQLNLATMEKTHPGKVHQAIDLARQVKNGDITIEQAKEQIARS